MIFVTSLETYYYYSGSNAGSRSELNLSRRHSLESSHQRHSSASGPICSVLVCSVESPTQSLTCAFACAYLLYIVG